MQRLMVSTSRKTELADITLKVQAIVTDMSVMDGVLYLFCPHTTAGLTLNENWDADVQHDMLLTIDGHIVPPDSRHRHAEGNSPAHIKASYLVPVYSYLSKRANCNSASGREFIWRSSTGHAAVRCGSNFRAASAWTRRLSCIFFLSGTDRVMSI